MFDLFKFIEGLLSGLAVEGLQGRVLDWLNTKAEQYPDLKDRIKALSDFIAQTITEASPELDPATMAATIKGIATDIVNGATGVDPKAYQGSV